MKPDGSPLGSPPLLYPILLAYLLGVALASHLNLPRPTLLAIMVALFLCVFLSMARSKKATSTVFWMGAFFWFGILTLQVQLNPPFQNNHIVHFTGRKRVVVEGILTRPPERSLKRTRLHLKVETLVTNEQAIAATGMVLLSLPNLEQPFDYGDRIRFASSLRRPANFNNPGGFDYQRYLATRKIWTTAFVNNPRTIIRVARRQGNVFRAWLETVRNHIRTFLDQHSLFKGVPQIVDRSGIPFFLE